MLADAVNEDLAGGSRVVARELAHGLAVRGHEVTFLVPRHVAETAPQEEPPPPKNIRVVRYGSAGLGGAAFVRAGQEACARLCAEQTFDVAHTHFAWAAVGPLRALPPETAHLRSFYGPWDVEAWMEDSAHLKTLADASPLQRLRAAAEMRVKRIMRHRVEAANLKRSRRVVVLSEQSRGEVAEFGYPDDRIHKIPGGADVTRFHPTKYRRSAREVLRLPQDRRILLSVRRLAPRMGLDNLIQAMPAVVKRHPNALLLIGGQGPYREQLETAIQATGMGEHIRLVGFIPDEDLVTYYQAADLFVLPTIALEGFGLVTVEALACGTPVLGTPVGATPEILNALDPRLVTSGVDPQALADSILIYLGGPWAKELTPERLSAFVRERYTWDRHVDAIEALYAEIAVKSSAPETQAGASA